MAEANSSEPEVRISYNPKFDHFVIKHPDGREFAYTYLTSAIAVIEGALKPNVNSDSVHQQD